MSTVLRFLRSLSIYWKILGIGAGVAFLFGSVTLVVARSAMSHALYGILEDQASSRAHGLAADCERPLITGDLYAVEQRIDRALEASPDLLFILVQDPQGDVVAHTFEGDVPDDLVPHLAATSGAEGATIVLDSADGLVVESSAPILDGKAGRLCLGLTDGMVRRELDLLTSSMIWALVLCAGLGMFLALLVTFLISEPIRELVEAARRIQRGDFDARAGVLSFDEIGTLALAFNKMAESLRGFRDEVKEKERARASLIERIVRVQEDERRNISRELHDHFGQSLSALLFAVRSDVHRKEIEGTIVGLIDDLRRLAWEMRPPVLDEYGLDRALSRYVKEMSRSSGMDIQYEYGREPGLGRAPARVEEALYRVAQEAVTNVVRHSGAERASVVVLQGSGEVLLLVEDDGRGFDLDGTTRGTPSSLGITGMMERVGLLGGDFQVKSSPGKGVAIRVTIPLREEQPCPSAS
ncbi:MAG: HAMP domain-containing protein [Planctomycetes bacterium]|nr:HAMP domain-containing protein [Planctomycetota bacterium]